MRTVSLLRLNEGGRRLIEFTIIIALVAIVVASGLSALGMGANSTIHNFTSSL